MRWPSDEILKRNTAGSGHSAQNITLPKWRSLERAFTALFFSDEDLEAGYEFHPDSIEHFVFTDEHLQRHCPPNVSGTLVLSGIRFSASMAA